MAAVSSPASRSVSGASPSECSGASFGPAGAAPSGRRRPRPPRRPRRRGRLLSPPLPPGTGAGFGFGASFSGMSRPACGEPPPMKSQFAGQTHAPWIFDFGLCVVFCVNYRRYKRNLALPRSRRPNLRSWSVCSLRPRLPWLSRRVSGPYPAPRRDAVAPSQNL